MKTTHRIIFGNSKNMTDIPSESVDLMITSPPYPMIQMWDELFSSQNPEIKKVLESGNGNLAFELMNKELDCVWTEVYRVLKQGGIACINIGDAVRSINNNFQLYPSHSRILNCCLNAGFQSLPEILWRKQTNAPNKFMGSGMLPPGAYVTLEHEFILILRKGTKREFLKPVEKQNRLESAFFWEERNFWFSDVWEDLKGTRQKMNGDKIRERSAAYPYELAYRLINMFSVKGDTVLDPYLGTGTTMAASMTSGRNSIGIEIDPNFRDTIFSRFEDIVNTSNGYIRNRIKRHIDFVEDRTKIKGDLKHKSEMYGFPVVTSQEVKILINDLKEIRKIADSIVEVYYKESPQEEFCNYPVDCSVSHNLPDKNTILENLESETPKIMSKNRPTLENWLQSTTQ